MCTYDNKAAAPLNENNFREYRRGYQKCIIQRNWQHRIHKTKINKIKTQDNMCWIPLYANEDK